MGRLDSHNRQPRRLVPPVHVRTAFLGALIALPAAGALVGAFQHPAGRPRPRAALTPAMPMAAPVPPAPAAPDEQPDGPARVTADVMDGLAAELAALARRAPARAAAIYVQDIHTGLTAGTNPNRRFVAASLIKLPVMAAAFVRWEERPSLKNSRSRDWMEQMITVSDNASTDRLIDQVGGPEVVTGFCAERGWGELKVRHAILNRRGRGGRNLCTAREVTEFLVALDQGQLVSEEADEEMWRILCRQKKRARIPGSLPPLPDVEVGSKTGTLAGVLHDAGIVRTPRSRYALCILLERQQSDPAGERFCRQVSRRVFEVMDNPAAAAPGTGETR